MGELAGIQQVLGTGGPPRDAEERRQGTFVQVAQKDRKATINLDAINPAGHL